MSTTATTSPIEAVSLINSNSDPGAPSLLTPTSPITTSSLISISSHANASSHVTDPPPEINLPQGTPLGVSTSGLQEQKLSKRCGTRAKKLVKKYLPILTWAPSYSLGHAARDAVAGLSVGLLTVPQVLAYSMVAGLPPNYGLYSTFVGCFLYVLFGSTPGLRIGPTAVMAILVEQYTNHGGPDYAVLICFTSGIIELLSAIFNAGFLVNFISSPVMSGFCSAAAITVMTSQLKALLGIKLPTKGVVHTWVTLVKNISLTNWPDLVLGVTCIISLVLLKNMEALVKCCIKKFRRDSIKEAPEKQTTKEDAEMESIQEDPEKASMKEEPKEKKNCAKGVFFFFSLGRNAIVVLLATLVAFITGGGGLTVTGSVEPGVPSFSVPSFSPVVGNDTVPFLQVLADVGVGVIVIPFIAIVDDLVIIRASFPSLSVDTNQEIAVLGLINLCGSFFRAMPTTASLSRTAVVNSSGGVTPASGLVDGLLVVAALAFLTPAFSWIPRASLSAVTMCAVIHLVDVHFAAMLWRARHKMDLLVLVVTFLTCLTWAIEWGVLLGALLHLLVLLFVTARPVVVVQAEVDEGKVRVTPHHGVRFPSIGHIRAKVQKILRPKRGLPSAIILDCSYITAVDCTAATGLVELAGECEAAGVVLQFVNLEPRLEKPLLATARDRNVALLVVATASADMNSGGVLECNQLGEHSVLPLEPPKTTAGLPNASSDLPTLLYKQNPILPQPRTSLPEPANQVEKATPLTTTTSLQNTQLRKNTSVASEEIGMNVTDPLLSSN
ncbi:sodium-independent sulfate anion transporter isoform X2 [Hyalella azteca]|uniref:Sodium-independent sulfate anion transporter isoform X2 n=2 Tax=Hyalella azteca TaxID=294128 RepID=A0A8B7NU53_HYAAZ|nr:sodium-independent sulfate anion transporter isoform X2 [Hyalella azteca]